MNQLIYQTASPYRNRHACLCNRREETMPGRQTWNLIRYSGVIQIHCISICGQRTQFLEALKYWSTHTQKVMNYGGKLYLEAWRWWPLNYGFHVTQNKKLDRYKCISHKIILTFEKDLSAYRKDRHDICMDVMDKPVFTLLRVKSQISNSNKFQ